VSLRPLRLLFIGEGLVLAGAIEIARSRGHEIAAVFSTTATEAAAMASASFPVFGPKGRVADFVASHDCDILFSIANGRILDAATLARPRLAAVNYHNGPLPAYAGMWVTAWAVFNGEEHHGITWHLIAPGIDTGPILVQRRFPLAPTETSGSLNLHCTEAALESLEEVFDKCEQGAIAGEPQDFSRRSYYGRSDTAPNGGVIDWNWPAENIVRLVRACDWGSSANAFGQAKLAVPGGGTHAVRSASVAPGTGAPGAVLASDDQGLVVACGAGAVRLRLTYAADLSSLASLMNREPCDHLVVNAPAPPAKTAAKRSGSFHSIVDAIAALADGAPHAHAIVDDGPPVTREVLTQRSRALATALLSAGLRPDDGVGILLPGGADFVAAALGAMRAGGAYVPLDPSSPPARLMYEIAEAGVTHVVADRDCSFGPADFPEVVFLTVSQFDGRIDDHDFPKIGPDQCAYRIFTSGSTGRPKAVEITHGALANLVAHYHNALPMGSGDRMTALAHTTFDASVGDIWPILSAGGALLIPPKHVLLEPENLIQWLARARATFAFVPTAIAERLFSLPWPKGMEFKTLLTGGSTLHNRPPPGLPFRVMNTYGPTENTVDSLWAEIGSAGGRPPIGSPIAGVTCTVVDDNRKPVRHGEIGELVLRGAQVARGYRGRPQLNAEHFDLLQEERAYFTGDLVRINSDGDFEFHGRIDDQIQLRGIRVEPGEIEALLKADPRVAEAVCLPVRNGTEVTGLTAHVSPAVGLASTETLAHELRDLLRGQLPAAIVPKEIKLHAVLPYTNAGKVDRLALIKSDDAVPLGDPSTRESDPIRATWLEVLPGAIGAGEDQSFWDLGGDSLAAIGLLMRLESTAGVRVPVGRFLTNPSLAGLRHAISLQRKSMAVRLDTNESKNPDNLVALQPHGQRAPLFVIHGYGGTVLGYVELARNFAHHRPVYGLQASQSEGIGPDQASVTAMAARYADQILEKQPQGPIHLLGYSAGGWYSHAVAAALVERGVSIGLFGVLDTGGFTLLRLNRRDRAFLMTSMMLARLRVHLAHLLQHPSELVRPHFLLGRLKAMNHHLRDFLGTRLAMPELAGTRSSSSTDSFGETAKNELPPAGRDAFMLLLRAYQPLRLPISADVFAPRNRLRHLAQIWGLFARNGLRCHPLFENHVDFQRADLMPQLAEALEGAITSIELEN
jgi:amino acid adenylation domain-containing protein